MSVQNHGDQIPHVIQNPDPELVPEPLSGCKPLLIILMSTAFVISLPWTYHMIPDAIDRIREHAHFIAELLRR